MADFVCPKCLGYAVEGICDYTKKIIHEEAGTVTCEIDYDGDVTDYLEFSARSTEEYDEEEPDVDDSDIRYHCKDCGYDTFDIDEFQREETAA